MTRRVSADIQGVQQGRQPTHSSGAKARGLRLPRLTHSLLGDLAAWMAALGIAVGLVFPLLAITFGIVGSGADTTVFLATSLGAGLAVGALGYGLVRATVGRRLRALTAQMEGVGRQLREANVTGDWSNFDPGEQFVVVDSEDELGDMALAYNRLLEELHSSHTIEAAVGDVFRALSSHLEIATLAQAALEQIVSHVDAESGVIFIVVDGEPRIAAFNGMVDVERLSELPELASLLSDAKREPETLTRAARTVTIDSADTPGSILMVPVAYRGELIGVVMLEATRAEHGRTERLLEIFTTAFAVALHNAIMHATSEVMAHQDPLTGCANRRSGLENFDHAFAQARATGTPLGVLMFDLDRFKSVNDRFGHPAGDAVLVHAARTARGCLREGDLLVRYGGEEFLVVIPRVPLERLLVVAERVRTAISGAPVPTEHGVVSVTASIGAAELTMHDVTTSAELLALADQALLAAKQGGRNRVVCADERHDEAA